MKLSHHILPLSLIALLFAACGDDPVKKTARGNNGANNGAMNNGAVNNGTANNGTANNGTANNSTNNPIVEPELCGNSRLDDGEECDGVPDTTCELLGFDGGYVTCGACVVDTSECTRETCGDGIIDSDEICDDAANNGLYGYCNTNCSGPAAFCGDSEINGPELCDAANLNGNTCQTAGYDGGTLGCSDTCGFDVSDCTTCGDGITEGDETCDDGVLNGSYGNCNTSCNDLADHCGDGILNGTEACDGTAIPATCASLGEGRGTVGCNTCVIDTSGCNKLPVQGQVVITEIMQNPALSTDNDGEYFEVYNNGTSEVDLNGCRIESSTSVGAEGFNITTSAVIPAGGYFVFARNSAAPFTADYTYNGQINLNNSTDRVALLCANPLVSSTDLQIVDEVSYDDGLTFPDPTGASMSLRRTSTNAASNDFGTNWCTATSAFGVGDRGTPGQPNDC